MLRHFGHYRLIRPIGEGATASVWLARLDADERSPAVALKIAHADEAGSPSTRARFAQEAAMLRWAGEHPNTPTLLEAGEHRGRPYLAMEWIDGLTVAELARRHTGPWPVGPAVAVAAAVLAALRHLHERSSAQIPWGVVHRDVTPHNVMIGRNGEVTLIDFGIAKPIGSRGNVADAMGNLGYVPREQVEGDADERADLFAAGALLFELLDGRRFRWHCADEDALFQEIYRDRVPALRREGVPRALRAALGSLLHFDRDRRVASAQQAAAMLEGWSDPEWARSELEGVFLAVAGQQAASRGEATEAELARLDAPRARARGRSSGATAAAEQAERGRYPWHADGEASARPHGRSTEAITTVSPALPMSGRAATGDEPLSAEREPTRRLASESSEEPLADGWEVLQERTQPHSRETGPQPRELDVPMARRAAEIAVTRPVPSRRAPWASEAPSRPAEAAAPRRGRRPSTDTMEAVSSVAPRSREGASMHQVANAMRGRPGSGEVVRGEIVADDAVGGPVWRLGPRR